MILELTGNNLNGFLCILTGDDTAPLPSNAIRAHPDFRMIVLANRPGFPFLGNDFFGALGKSFLAMHLYLPRSFASIPVIDQLSSFGNENLAS